ncbi:preprotein translocase subunit YajC [Acidocella sp.]|uniref:preprotein translocase subunit YajC n=1 Tax=Acidocella sp. TaxID=50710 RepID=UPI002627F0DE|nr:preprotein translocase subunit YajC [Acidocella sp.]
MFMSEAFAQTATPAGNSMFVNIVQYGPILLIVAVFYFLLILPQQKQQKALKTKLNALKRGDKVVTAGGIVGVVKKTTEGAENVEVEIAPNVVVNVVRSTIGTVLGTADKA